MSMAKRIEPKPTTKEKLPSKYSREGIVVRLILSSGFRVHDIHVIENEDGSESWKVELKKEFYETI